MTPDLFTVTAEFAGDGHWRVWRGNSISNVKGPAWPAQPAQLAVFADALCCGNAGWSIRSVVFVAPTPSGTGAIKVTTYPRHVWVLSPGRALVQTFDDTPAAVVVDPHTHSASVHIADAERPIADTDPDRLVEVMRALNITRLLVRRMIGTEDLVQLYRERCPQTVEVVDCPPESVRTGAEQFAARLMENDGVWFTSGRTTLMRHTRDISYSIHHTRYGAFDGRDSTLAEATQGAQILMVVDRNVNAIHGSAIRAYSRKHLDIKAIVIVDGCEQSKNIDQVEDICRATVETALPRNGLIVGVGGGVTLDIAGVAASIVRRGLRYLRVPTTLVGLVDVSVGIKHGVNAFGRKNILGSFFPPTASVNDYSLIRTSPAYSISCGLAEIVKIAMVRDETLLAAVENHGQELLRSCCQLPAEVASSVMRRAEILMMEELASNLFENDSARLADFGHTFSPAIETLSGYRIAHGEAVALDMLMSTEIGVAKGLCDSDLLERLTTLFRTLDLPIWDERLPDLEQCRRALDAAAAHRGGNLNLVVPTRAGAAAFVQHVTTLELTAALDWMQSNAVWRHVDLKEQTDCASAGF